MEKVENCAQKVNSLIRIIGTPAGCNQETKALAVKIYQHSIEYLKEEILCLTYSPLSGYFSSQYHALLKFVTDSLSDPLWLKIESSYGHLLIGLQRLSENANSVHQTTGAWKEVTPDVKNPSSVNVSSPKTKLVILLPRNTRFFGREVELKRIKGYLITKKTGDTMGSVPLFLLLDKK